MSALSLTEVEAEYRKALGGGQVLELDLTPLDRTGVPTMAVIWTSDYGQKNSAGYGTTLQQARVSALGELCEGVFPDAALEASEPVEGSYSDLTASLGTDQVADPLELVLSAGSDYSPDRPLVWSRATRWRTGEPVLVPVEFLASKPAPVDRKHPGRPRLITPISNGLGAGSSLEQAVSHGLLELLQRDGDTVSFRALDQGVVLDPASLGDPRLDEILAEMRGAGIDATIKVAADEFVPVLYCVGEDRHPERSEPIALSAIGEAAHPDPRVAARKAVLEFAASRARRLMAFGDLDRLRPHFPDYIDEARELGVGAGQEQRALDEMVAWCRMDHAELRRVLEPIFSERTTLTADRLVTARDGIDAGDMLPFLLERLADFDVLVMPGAAPADGAIHTAKVIAPRIEVETLSYSRIGERVANRLLDRGDPLVARHDGPGRRRIRVTDAAEERLGGPVWLDSERLDAVLGSLYPLYREPGWHAAPLLA